MNIINQYNMKKALVVFLIIILWAGTAFSYPVVVIDAKGKESVINEKPKCVVSLVPSVTEVIFEIGAGDVVKGITYHDVHLPDISRKKIKIMGGLF